jgi:hypothetical protein
MRVVSGRSSGIEILLVIVGVMVEDDPWKDRYAPSIFRRHLAGRSRIRPWWIARRRACS